MSASLPYHTPHALVSHIQSLLSARLCCKRRLGLLQANDESNLMLFIFQISLASSPSFSFCLLNTELHNVEDRYDFGNSFRATMVAQLSTGDHHDFVVSCGGHTFKVYRNILAANSDFFRAAVGMSFSEGVNRRLDLPDDDPVLVARMLAFMYTRDYCVRNLTRTPLGIELAQFHGITDTYSFDPFKPRDVKQHSLLHCHMFALADKYNFEDLRSTAFARFHRSLHNKDEENLISEPDFEDMDEEWDVWDDWQDQELDDEPAPFQADTADEIVCLVKAVYTNTPPHVRELRDILMDFTARVFGGSICPQKHADRFR